MRVNRLVINNVISAGGSVDFLVGSCLGTLGLRVSHAGLPPRGVAVSVPEYEGVVSGVVEKVDRGFLVQVSKDPDVHDWLISVSELDNTRGDYLKHVARFLAWTSWMPNKVWELKREAFKLGEPQSQVEVQIRRYHCFFSRQMSSGV